MDRSPENSVSTQSPHCKRTDRNRFQALIVPLSVNLP
ncbi:uncharacterized protein FFB20_05872 [Fusarium fujikuroi]|nr:uncharacterized protein FFB20_05872 [Fusarium fujikuroi]